MNLLPFLFIDLFQVSEFCLIESDDPVVDNYPGVVPPVAAVKEEDQRPFADPVQEFLGRHIRIQLTLEKQEVGVERDVDDGFAGSIVRDYQPRRGGSCKPGGGEFVEPSSRECDMTLNPFIPLTVRKKRPRLPEATTSTSSKRTK